MEQLYSLQSAAEKLDVSVRTVRRLIKEHELVVKRVGSRIRIPETELQKVVQEEVSNAFIAEQLYQGEELHGLDTPDQNQ